MKRLFVFLFAALCGNLSWGQDAAQSIARPKRTNAIQSTTTVSGTYQQRQIAPAVSGQWTTQARQNNQTKWVPSTAQEPAASFFTNSQQAKLQSKIDGQLRKYRSADDSKQKSQIEDEVRELLSEQFDERLKEPTARIEKSRARLDELKSQLKSRSDKTDEIIDLRIKVLTHQILGLGWGQVPHPNVATGYPIAVGQYYSRLSAYNPGQPVPYAVQGVPYPSTAKGVPLPPKATGRDASGYIYPDYYPAPKGPGAVPSLPARPSIQKQNADDDKPTVHQLLADFKKAKNDSDRKPIVKELKSLLMVEFEAHQKQLSASVERIEVQIEKLEENVAQRKKMKDSIVDLKLKTLINQANGLGF